MFERKDKNNIEIFVYLFSETCNFYTILINVFLFSKPTKQLLCNLVAIYLQYLVTVK